MTPEPREWYCPNCRRFVASEELNAPQAREPTHLPCKGKAERRIITICTEEGKEPKRVTETQE